MKFIRQRVKLLDNKNMSCIISRVSLNTKDFLGNHEKCCVPNVELQMKSCRHVVEYHDFGETRVAQIRKLNIMIAELQKTKDEVSNAWDKYDNFWLGRTEETEPKATKGV